MSGALEFLREVIAAGLAQLLTRQRRGDPAAAEMADLDFTAILEQLKLDESLVPIRVQVITIGAEVLISPQPAEIVGIILRAGAADAILRVYNQGSPGAQATNELPGVRTATYDGFVGMPTRCSEGILVSLDRTDAIGWIWYRPIRDVAHGP